jgi:hypothetical protein
MTEEFKPELSAEELSAIENESERQRALFNDYMSSTDVAERTLNRLKINDASNRKSEARMMIWQLCTREENPAEGCIFFIENFGWTFDPRKPVKHIPFVLFDFQKDAIRFMVDHMINGKDCLFEKSRDMGVTWIVVWVFYWFWLFRDGVNLLMGSYKEKLVDDRTDDSIFGRLDYCIDSTPKWLLPKGFKKKAHRTKLRLINPANNNLISGDTMNPDFGRGSRKTAIFFDELGSWDYAKDAWESCGDVTTCRVANSTPKGRNFYFDLRNSGIDVLTLHWTLNPLKDQKWYEFEKTRRSEEEIAQELDISYSKSQEGRVYREWDENFVETGFFPYDPHLPLYIGWDFGKTDDTAIIWTQPYGGKLRVVDCYSKSGQNIDFFIPFITGMVGSELHRYSKFDYEVIDEHRNWKRGMHFGDPAGRFKNGVTDATVLSVLRDAGIMVNYQDSWKEFQNRKRAAKAIIRNGIQINKNKRTDGFSAAMEQASYPQVTSDGQKTVRSEKPKHDWTSHYRSAFEYLSLGLEELIQRKTKARDRRLPKAYDDNGRRKAVNY